MDQGKYMKYKMSRLADVCVLPVVNFLVYNLLQCFKKKTLKIIVKNMKV